MSRPLTCRMCAAPLDLDQRYCIECGERARPVPRWVAGALGLLPTWVPGSQADPEAPKGPLLTPAEPIRIGPLVIPWATPTPRAAALSVLTVLWFGIAIGAASLADAGSPLNVLVFGGSSPAAATVPAAAPASAGGSGGGGGGSGGAAPVGTTKTIYTTTPNTATSTSTTPTTTTTKTSTGPTYPTNTGLPPIHNVWVIVLGDKGYSQTFAADTGDTYLHDLGTKGEVVPNYYGVTSGDLANEFAMITGQGPTESTAVNCPKFTVGKGLPGIPATLDQFQGQGCVFPDGTPDLPDELTAAGFTWKAYVQGLGNSGSTSSMMLTRAGRKARKRAARARRLAAHRTKTERTARKNARAVLKHGGITASTSTGAIRIGSGSAAFLREAQFATLKPSHARTHTLSASEKALTCRYPKLNSTDPFHTVTGKSTYVTWRNPFVYLDSIITSTSCGKTDVGTDQLAGDLKSSKKTPNVSFILPDPCDDGSVTPCIKGAAAGNAPLNKFLQPVVKEIMASAAYKAGGLILITSAQAPQSGPDADSSTCCGSPTSYPNLAGITTTTTTTTTGVTTTATTAITGTVAADATTPATTTGTTTTGTTTTGTGTGTTTTGTTTTPLPPGVSLTGGGGQVGLLLLTNYVLPGPANLTDTYSHFSLVGSIEKIFGIPYTGYALSKTVPKFNAALFTAG